MLTTKLARKARAVGVAPDGDAEALAADAAFLSARAAAADPGSDDPLSTGADSDEAVRVLGRSLYALATLAQRLGIDAEQALRDRALRLRDDIISAEGVPEGEQGNR
jgi:hypothetical protein